MASTDTNPIPPCILQHPDQLTTFHDARLYTLYTQGKPKCINDNYGHLIGDNLLKQLAALLQDKLRSCDVVTRFGGEEFIILLPETGLADATALAAKLREQVEVYSFSDLDDEGITISVGLAEWHQDDDAATLIRRADLAMYKAKQAGRNRVEVAGGDIKSSAMAVSGS